MSFFRVISPDGGLTEGAEHRFKVQAFNSQASNSVALMFTTNLRSTPHPLESIKSNVSLITDFISFPSCGT